MPYPFLKHPIDFGDVHSSEEVIKSTWNDFRDALKNREFTYEEVSKATASGFLKVFDELFMLCTDRFECSLKNVERNSYLKRGSILAETEAVDYERFLPKAEFITQSNRFSPVGVEWLYLAVSRKETRAEECTIKECRASSGNRFGICTFSIKREFENKKIIDLTVADDLTYEQINSRLECTYKEICRARFIRSRRRGRAAAITVAENNKIKNAVEDWAFKTYLKLMSEQIFKPLEDTDDRNLMYAPFQCIAQYFLDKGYSGIKYKSTVCESAKDIVLFDKTYAHPVGDIKDFII